MKKLLFLVMALALVAFALPALAQDINDNDINGNNAAVGNTIGNANVMNNQFEGAVGGDRYAGGGVNGSSVTINDNGSRNTDDNSAAPVNKSNIVVTDNGSRNNIDDSGTGSFLNKSAVVVAGVGNDNWINNAGFFITITANDSLNNNNIYSGPMNEAWRFQYEQTHRFDHQLFFPTTFQDSSDPAIFMPINPVHLSQSNTGMNVGDYAGASVGAVGVQFSADHTNVTGMFLGSQNAGGVAQNQAAANVVTAFSAR